MLNDYASVSGNELWNTARLNAYIANVGSPFTTGGPVCSCETITPRLLGEDFDAYTTPEADPAPWYDADTPESAEFLGFLPLSVTGTNDNPRARGVTNSVGGGGVFGPSRALPRTITVTGLLLGTTCCGVDYGMQYLTEVLEGCTGDACDGDCFEMYNCCPEPGTTPEQFAARNRRTFRRTALVSGPTEIKRDGNGDCARSQCAAGGDVVTVEFVLVAGTPWAWTDPVPLLDVALPQPDLTDCVTWCLSAAVIGPNFCPPGSCQFESCDAGQDPCGDPLNMIPAPPQPTAPATAFCMPLAPERACYTIDLTDRPTWSSDVPTITIAAGTRDLRNVRVTFYEKRSADDDCDATADAQRCNPVNDFVISYVPALNNVTIDGQISRAVMACGDRCTTSSTVYGNPDGAPVTVAPLSCALYCVCIEVDSLFPPAEDAQLSLSVSGRGL